MQRSMDRNYLALGKRMELELTKEGLEMTDPPNPMPEGLGHA